MAKKDTKQIVYILLIMMAIISCTRTNNGDGNAESIDNWLHKVFILPERVCNILGEDSIYVKQADFVFVTYVDSGNCTSCKMKLPLWDDYLILLDSLTEATVFNLFLLHPSNNIDEIRVSHSTEFDHYYYVDTDNIIFDTNTLARIPYHRTFLLDANLQIVTIGNPIINRRVASLDKAIISGEETFSREGNAKLIVNNNQINLGSVQRNQIDTIDISIENKGLDTAYVRKIIPSCNCVELILSQNFIAPQDSCSARLIFTTDSITGYFRRYVDIFYRGIELPSSIHIQGSVK